MGISRDSRAMDADLGTRGISYNPAPLAVLGLGRTEVLFDVGEVYTTRMMRCLTRDVSFGRCHHD